MMSSTVPKPTTCIERLKLQAEAVLPKYAPYLTDRALCYYYLNAADKVLKDALARRALEILNLKQEAREYYRKCCQLEPNKKEYNDVLREALGTSATIIIDKSNNQTSKHDYVTCDVCKCYPIIDVRYKCSICDNYNLCSKCLNSNPNKKEHQDTHLLTPN